MILIAYVGLPKYLLSISASLSLQAVCNSTALCFAAGPFRAQYRESNYYYCGAVGETIAGKAQSFNHSSSSLGQGKKNSIQGKNQSGHRML